MDDPNRLRHIVGEPRHNLAPLVRQCGSEEAAAKAIQHVVDAAFADGNLVFDDDGLFKQALDIGGNLVTVSGRVIDGAVHVATAWIS